MRRMVQHDSVEVACQAQANSYEGTFGSSGWGHRASEKLKHTRGKSFRHEKTKAKRGSYRGGSIDRNSVNSYKFGDDEW